MVRHCWPDGSVVHRMSKTLRADVVVCGGSLSAVAAALAAARTNPHAQVLLIEPTDWLGGQATSQGVSAIDNAWFDPGRTIMEHHPDDHYAADYLQFLRSMNDPGVPGEGMAPKGTGWVSRECFDPRSAAFVLERMVAEHENLELRKLTVVKTVETFGGMKNAASQRIIKALKLIEREPRHGYRPFSEFLSREFEDWYDPFDSDRFTKTILRVEPQNDSRELIVIDASELGDAMVLSGCQWVQGRELETEELNRDGSLPAMDDDGSQPVVFPFCVTDAPKPAAETALSKSWSDFDAYKTAQAKELFSLKQFTWERVWTYRRLKTTGAMDDFDAIHRGDVSMQNWEPGNDYPYASLLLNREKTLDEARENWRGGVDPLTVAGCEKHAMAWYFWLKEHCPADWDTQYLQGDHPLNMMGTEHGLAKFPYVRCARRIVGPENFRITSATWKNTEAPEYDGSTGERFYDRVGIGAYAADVHERTGSRGTVPGIAKPAPFYIPYRALCSRNVVNLLACGKNMAQTYIANSAYRLHPIEWAGGSAAGVAAALMARDQTENTDFLKDNARLKNLQARVGENSPIGWKAMGD